MDLLSTLLLESCFVVVLLTVLPSEVVVVVVRFMALLLLATVLALAFTVSFAELAGLCFDLLELLELSGPPVLEPGLCILEVLDTRPGVEQARTCAADLDGKDFVGDFELEGSMEL